MDYIFLVKLYLNKLKNYLRVRGLKMSGDKNELVALVFFAMENNVIAVKTAKRKI